MPRLLLNEFVNESNDFPSARDTAPGSPSGDHVVITCEHGGARIPSEFHALFEPFRQLLATHRGYDFGALEVAREMAVALNAPLFASTTSRLLVDLNRSVGNPALHSEATRGLHLSERRQIVERYWRPYRHLVESHVAKVVERGQCVVHIASHSFTPELHGVVRTADIGLLYDPRRPGEGHLARLWQHELTTALPAFRVRLNYPYAGKGDGLTAFLRRTHSPDQYVGIEFELNQQHVVAGGVALRSLRKSIVDTLRLALAKFAEMPRPGH